MSGKAKLCGSCRSWKPLDGCTVKKEPIPFGPDKKHYWCPFYLIIERKD